MSIADTLNDIPRGHSQADPTWFDSVRNSLIASASEWLAYVSKFGFTKGQAWALLSWIETAATEIVRSRDRDLLVTCAFAMALVLRSDLDPRDCSVVASLLKRAASLADLDFAACCAEGCRAAGELGDGALELLTNASAITPVTHVETGVGMTFSFSRRPTEFDLDKLLRWLDDDQART